MAWYGYALLSALAIATVGLLQKKTLQHQHTAEYVAIFGIIKVLIFFSVTQSAIQWTVPNTILIWLLIDGLVGATAFFMVAKATRLLELSTAMPILSLDPGLVALLALVFLGERITGTQLIGLGLMLIGTYILELRHYPAGWWTKANFRPGMLFDPFRELAKGRGGHFAILGLIFFSISGVIDRFVLQHVTPTTYLAYILPTMAVVYILFFLRAKQPLEILRPGRGYVIFIIILIAALHLGSNFAQAKAVSLAAVGLVIAVKRLSVLIDVIVGGKFFHEHNLMQKAVASTIMLAGVYFIVR